MNIEEFLKDEIILTSKTSYTLNELETFIQKKDKYSQIDHPRYKKLTTILQNLENTYNDIKKFLQQNGLETDIYEDDQIKFSIHIEKEENYRIHIKGTSKNEINIDWIRSNIKEVEPNKYKGKNFTLELEGANFIFSFDGLLTFNIVPFLKHLLHHSE